MTEPTLVTPQKNPRSRDNLFSVTSPNASHPGKEPAASRTTVPAPQQQPGHRHYLDTVPAHAFQGPM